MQICSITTDKEFDISFTIHNQDCLESLHKVVKLYQKQLTCFPYFQKLFRVNSKV